jgi:hypothetical protein
MRPPVRQESNLIAGDEVSIRGASRGIAEIEIAGADLGRARDPTDAREWPTVAMTAARLGETPVEICAGGATDELLEVRGGLQIDEPDPARLPARRRYPVPPDESVHRCSQRRHVIAPRIAHALAPKVLARNETHDLARVDQHDGRARARTHVKRRKRTRLPWLISDVDVIRAE